MYFLLTCDSQSSDSYLFRILPRPESGYLQVKGYLFPDSKKRSPPSGRDLRFLLFSKEEIEAYQNTERDPIIAKHLKIMLFDVSKQKADDKQR